MSLTITVVHAPAALRPEEWAALHRCAGRMPHELRLAMSGLRTPSGAQLHTALLEWIAEQLPHLARSSGRELHSSTAGTPLSDLPADAPQIHPGMVVVLSPQPLTCLLYTSPSPRDS